MKNKKNPSSISNCTFTGVKYNKSATDAVVAIADALRINAEALSKLAGILNASQVRIETMVKMDE